MSTTDTPLTDAEQDKECEPGLVDAEFCRSLERKLKGIVPWDEFKSFSRIPRLSREVIVTEKIDGTNGVISIDETGTKIRVGSRNRWLSLDSDNFGFCHWVAENQQEIFNLGPGRHYGEFWGQGIQRGYGLTEKRFSLFNVTRWVDRESANVNLTQEFCPACCSVVPVLWRGVFCTAQINRVMIELAEHGSYAAPGFMKPEGVVIYHAASGQLFKKTLENDEEGKPE